MRRSKTEFCLIAILSLAGISIRPAFAGSYIFSTITHSGETDSYASSVNDWGAVVGSFYTADAKSPKNFAWFEGKSTLLPQSVTLSTSLNNRNLIGGTIGSSTDTATVLLNAFTGKIVRIPMKSGYKSFPVAINDASNVVGIASTSNLSVQTGFASNGKTTSYLTPPGDVDDSAALLISDSGVVYGTYFDKSANIHEYYFANGVYTDFFPPGPVKAVDSAGAFAGTSPKAESGQLVYYGYRQQNGKTESYLYPGSDYTDIIGFAAKGALVGMYEDGNGPYKFFVTFKGVYYPLSFPGAASTWITGVSGIRGNLAGYYYDTAGLRHAFVAICPSSESPCTH
jgi:hypothetical protein